MLSLSPGGMTASHATKYFSQEDYYLRGDEPSQWVGKGSEALGLGGRVSEADFRYLTDGKAPDGTQLVAHKITHDQDGKDVEHHRAGNDLTFSAPKSVSVGYAAGNQELKDIWDQAVVNTMRHVEEHYSNYRTRDGVKSSGNIVAAKFDHVTSRALDPEVHSHVFLFNMTRVPGAGGKWKANEPKNIYTDKISLGMLARQEAMNLYHRSGYRTYFTNRQQLLFEIEGVRPEELETFSKRSAEIAAKVAQWKEEKRFPGVSETILKQMAALDTRDPKRQVTREDVRREWDRGFASAGTSAQSVLDRIEAARPLQPAEKSVAAAAADLDPGFRFLAPGEYPPSLAVVVRHAKVPELKQQPGYEKAKRCGDLDAARQVVDSLIRPEVVDHIRCRLPSGRQLYVVAVANREGPQSNMLPAAYAERLAKELGGEVWTGVAKVTGGHNTGAAIDTRLHNRQVFQGDHRPGEGERVRHSVGSLSSDPDRFALHWRIRLENLLWPGEDPGGLDQSHHAQRRFDLLGEHARHRPFRLRGSLGPRQQPLREARHRRGAREHSGRNRPDRRGGPGYGDLTAQLRAVGHGRSGQQYQHRRAEDNREKPEPAADHRGVPGCQDKHLRDQRHDFKTLHRLSQGERHEKDAKSQGGRYSA
jgi:conjugative relaxase-like TrwC/TraI family protein